MKKQKVKMPTREFRLIAIAVIAILIAFSIGFVYGAEKGFKECIDIGLKFLKIKNISLDVNENLLRQEVYFYKNSINKQFEQC